VNQRGGFTRTQPGEKAVDPAVEFSRGQHPLINSASISDDDKNSSPPVPNLNRHLSDTSGAGIEISVSNAESPTCRDKTDSQRHANAVLESVPRASGYVDFGRNSRETLDKRVRKRRQRGGPSVGRQLTASTEAGGEPKQPPPVWTFETTRLRTLKIRDFGADVGIVKWASINARIAGASAKSGKRRQVGVPSILNHEWSSRSCRRRLDGGRAGLRVGGASHHVVEAWFGIRVSGGRGASLANFDARAASSGVSMTAGSCGSPENQASAIMARLRLMNE